MRIVLRAALATLVACGGLLLVLGIIMWTGGADGLVGVHVVVGLVLVADLWFVALVAARSGVPPAITGSAAAWGALVVALGLLQEDLVEGTWHWTIQVVHLALSMGVVGWGRRLLQLIARSRPAGVGQGTKSGALGATPGAVGGR